MGKCILVLSERLGSGDDELGALLMRNFLYSLAREERRPEAVCMGNGAVRLACEGSESLDDLALLVQNGVAVRVCGTCLDYLGLKDSLAVGEPGTMPEMVAKACGGSEVVTIA